MGWIMGTNTIIIILGTPRSGTSVITRALPVMGVKLGNELVAPSVNNPTGFWEDIRVQQINVQLLQLAGRHIEWPVLAADKIALSPHYSAIKRQAIELLKQRLQCNPIWAFKDPRASRLLFFWQDVFQEIGCVDRYVLALRDPISVAESLMLSSGLRRSTGLALWLECTVRVVQDTRHRPLVVVAYERMMDNPGAEILRMAGGLDLEESLLPDEFDYYTGHFISPELMHIKHHTDNPAEHVRELPLIHDVYTLLYRLASDAVTGDEFGSSWSALYTRFEHEFPEFVAANKWLETPKTIAIPNAQRIYCRLRAHGISEIRRLSHRVLEKSMETLTSGKSSPFTDEKQRNQQEKATFHL